MRTVLGYTVEAAVDDWLAGAAKTVEVYRARSE